mmetsp:Transcript_658/g.1157  ORF Transcript_658/g.1157 Transcript_658/m.1157 type:complete len:343 (+) Transcript_658:480-1508(+)
MRHARRRGPLRALLVLKHLQRVRLCPLLPRLERGPRRLRPSHGCPQVLFPPLALGGQGGPRETRRGRRGRVLEDAQRLWVAGRLRRRRGKAPARLTAPRKRAPYGPVGRHQAIAVRPQRIESRPQTLVLVADPRGVAQVTAHRRKLLLQPLDVLLGVVLVVGLQQLLGPRAALFGGVVQRLHLRVPLAQLQVHGPGHVKLGALHTNAVVIQEPINIQGVLNQSGIIEPHLHVSRVLQKLRNHQFACASLIQLHQPALLPCHWEVLACPCEVLLPAVQQLIVVAVCDLMLKFQSLTIKIEAQFGGFRRLEQLLQHLRLPALPERLDVFFAVFEILERNHVSRQ